MIGYSSLAFLIGLGLCLPAAAQQVPNPATAPVTNNAALKTMPGTPQGAIRLGFATPGDGGHQRYNWSPTNCTAPDDGAQVQPTGTGCWVADIDKAHGANVKIWGARGANDMGDDAPAFRAACAYALSTAGEGVTIRVPAGYYWLRSKDPRDKGMIYLSNGANDERGCSIIGPEANVDYSNMWTGAPATIALADNMNRPILYMPKQGSTPKIKNLILFGNKAGQNAGLPGVAYPAGPGGRLYIVEIADILDVPAGDNYPETGISFDRVVLEHGYNGNLYVGAWRFTWTDKLWSQFAGQNDNDCSIWEQGFDSQHRQVGIGSNTGCGLLWASGAQMQLTGGAMWNNSDAGLKVGGYKVNYGSIANVNFQYNKFGIRNTNDPAFTGDSSAGGIACTNCTFDGNTRADVVIDAQGTQVNRQMKFIAPSFMGATATATYPKPIYNIEIGGVTTPAAVVDVIAPNLGTQGNPFQTAFTNAPSVVYCTGAECPSTAFLPVLGNGTPTYTIQQGYIVRHAGMSQLFIALQTSAIGSPTGNMTIGNIPYSANLANSFGPCAVGPIVGWTGATGFTSLAAIVPPNANFISIHENGSGKVQQASLASEWGAISNISLSCTYIAAK